MKDVEYVRITRETAFGAKEMAYGELEAITSGNVDTAILLTKQYLELEKICKEFEEKEEQEPETEYKEYKRFQG